MKRKFEIDRLASLSLEERASAPKKEIPYLIPLIIFVVGFVSGLVYWFGVDFLFSYRSVGPFWGFALLTLIGIALAIIVDKIYDFYWRHFNKLITAAREEILRIINSGEASEEDLERYKKIYIETKIGEKPLTEEEFEWHSTRFCWGCGGEQIDVPVPYVVHKERTETWTEGNFKYSKTFNHKATILLCPKCYDRLVNSKIVADKESVGVNIVFWVLLVLVNVVVFTIMYINEFNRTGDVGDAIGNGFLGLLISFGVALSLSKIILWPLSVLITLPFSKYKNMDTSKKWDFDNIPSIRHFLDRDLPHTK